MNLFSAVIMFISLALMNLAVASPTSQSTHQLTKRIPAAIYQAGQYTLAAQGTPIVVLDKGVQVAFQIADSNLVVYVNGVPKWNSQVKTPPCTPPNHCILSFQPDGNLVSYLNNAPTWASWTQGGGQWLVFFDQEPYIVIYNAAYQPIWHTPITPPAAVPVPKQAKGGSFIPLSTPIFDYTVNFRKN